MALYSKVVEDKTILELVKDRKNILVIGCGGCINESLAYDKKVSIFKKIDGRRIAYATHRELKRVSELLSSKECRVKVLEEYDFREHCEEGFLCIRKRGVDFNLLEKLGDFIPDVILSLCCTAGTYGLEDTHNNDVPIIQIAKPIGMLGYLYYDEDDERKIDFGHTKVIPI